MLLMIQVAAGIVLASLVLSGFKAVSGWRSRRSWQKRMTSLTDEAPSAASTYVAMWLPLILLACVIVARVS